MTASADLRRAALRTATGALAAVAAGLVGRAILERGFEVHAPYAAFLASVLIAGLLAGDLAGLLSLIAFILVGVSSLEPTTVIATRSPLTGLFLFALTGSLLVCFTALVNRSRARARDALAVLRESERRYKVLAETVPDFVWSCEPGGRPDYFNPRYVAYTGLPPEQFDQHGWREVVHPDDHAAVQSAWARSLRDGVEFELEFRYRRRSDGACRWFLTRTVPVRDEGGRIVRWVGAATDVHEAKVAREERERLLAAERAAREEAERAGRVKDQFLAVLSHELRTPLTPVLLTVSLLESSPDLPANLREDVMSIRRNVELEARLIDDLLDLTRIARGKIRFDFQTVDLHAILRSALSISCADGKLAVRTNFAGAGFAGAGREPIFVRADPARLQQVFCNVLNNAWKFTPAGGAVTVRTENRGETAAVCISDTGEGIEADALQRVFDAFEQGDAVRARTYGGLGLGLAICKSLLEAHGGTISASSPGRGRGAAFVVELPTAAAPAQAEHVPDTPHPGHGGLPGANGNGSPKLRMLLVEDHPTTLRALSRLLQSVGHHVDGVSSVADGLRAAGSNRYDLVISDLGLPDGNGYDLMRQLRAMHGLTGIALSGFGMEEDLKRSREAGFSDHLVKPVDLPRLQEAIARVSFADNGDAR